MTELSHRDLQDVLSATRRALECSEVDEMREQVLYCLEKIFKCDVCSFFLAQKSREELDHAGGVARGVESRVRERYIQHYYRVDPNVQWLPFLPAVARLEEIIPFKELVRSEYYAGHLEPRSLRYAMTMVLRSGGRLIGSVRLARTRRAGNFSSRDKAKAELLVPYLVRILEEKMLSGQNKCRAEIFESITKNLPFKGVVFLDECLDPFYMDEDAYTLLSSLCTDEEKESESRLSVPQEIIKQCEELRKSLLDKDGSDLLERRFYLDGKDTIRRLSILLKLLDAKNMLRGFLVCIKPDDPVLNLGQRLNSLGLTQREREVVCLICKGLENPEIADRLCISKSTVANHLKSIYEKLGVQNRTTLVHRMMSLS
jgi:DNA-binding CsgD family transcriptional regulator